ncbi:MAG: M18 family aminopeptidase, partial [Nitrospinaceae bacterium]
MKKNEKKYQVRSRSLLDFIDKSPTPFHAVKTLKDQLKKAEYVELYEHEEWKISAGGQYFVVRNDSSLVAFSVGSEKPQDSGFKIIGAHTDSPNLRLKPNPAYVKNGYVQLGVEVYGGALLSTWTDRDLSLAGRVILKVTNEKSSKTVHDKYKSLPSLDNYGCVTRLVKFNRPLLRIPQLAIHLNRSVNEKGLVL